MCVCVTLSNRGAPRFFGCSSSDVRTMPIIVAVHFFSCGTYTMDGPTFFPYGIKRNVCAYTAQLGSSTVDVYVH